MVYQQYNERLLSKMNLAFDKYHERSYVKLFDAKNVKKHVTKEHYRTVPTKNWFKLTKGEEWGGRWMNMWVRFGFKVPAEAANQPLYLGPDMTYREGLMFVNGKPYGIFNGEGHSFQQITAGAPEGTEFDVATEFYAGHPNIGCEPFANYGYAEDPNEYKQTYNGMVVYTINRKLWEFTLAGKCIFQMARVLPKDNVLKKKAYDALEEIFMLLQVHPQFMSDEEINAVLDDCIAIVDRFKEENKLKGEDSSRAVVGILGHSHMDTAWLWPVDETIRKCARTYANALHMMELYPEYNFIQSSALHSEWMKDYYPTIFEDMKKRVAEGRYEPNGGVFVECDCNITSGEAMIRQFLKGQMFTRENFNYTADSFWLPDTFGYSAAIPQIMKGCNVKYFNTTKIGWNDLNYFPIDTFKWKGIDGSEVLTHFNITHRHPNPEDIVNVVNNEIRSPQITNKKLYAYGFGDGGGGPFEEMIAEGTFSANIEGLPNIRYTTVSEFMQDLEKDQDKYPTYTGELYLELHRGTLTQMHQIKRNNRKAEFALRDAEYLNVASGAKKDPAADRKLKTLLKNQFHDILPGSSITEVNVKSVEEMTSLIGEYNEDIAKYSKKMVSDDDGLTVFNTLSFERNDDIYLEGIRGGVKGAKNQKFTDLNGKKITVVGGVKVPSFSAKKLELTDGYGKGKSAFVYDGKKLETPFAYIEFDENGAISSYINKKTGRQLKKENGESLNTFWLAEDVPQAWDNWDIDADAFLKMKPDMRLVSRELVSEGPVQLRIRSEYKIGKRSTIKQDMIFHANSEQIDFHTIVDWDEQHTLLKAGFDVDVWANTVKNEIQYGHVERPTTQNNSIEAAKFEVCNHKWTDISESRFGVAVLNDCKYGISVENGNLRLSLHRGGRHPDYTNDKGVHEFTYSFLPHDGAMSTENVIRPSYMLNSPVIVANGAAKNEKSFMEISAPNVICEAVKYAEYAEKAFVVRLYECERNRTSSTVKFGKKVKKVYATNMLEDIIEELPVENNSVDLTFRPFEIKTLLVEY
ncbi:MAG: alpha-mannosidase [Clostridia bacterium]|nr:alpha-mannosidase [Clostridia bacterium]